MPELITLDELRAQTVPSIKRILNSFGLLKAVMKTFVKAIKRR